MLPDIVVQGAILEGGSRGTIAVEVQRSRYSTAHDVQTRVRTYMRDDAITVAIFLCCTAAILTQVRDAVEAVPGSEQKIRYELFTPIELAGQPI